MDYKRKLDTIFKGIASIGAILFFIYDIASLLYYESTPLWNLLWFSIYYIHALLFYFYFYHKVENLMIKFTMILVGMAFFTKIVKRFSTYLGDEFDFTGNTIIYLKIWSTCLLFFVFGGLVVHFFVKNKPHKKILIYLSKIK